LENEKFVEAQVSDTWVSLNSFVTVHFLEISNLSYFMAWYQIGRSWATSGKYWVIKSHKYNRYSRLVVWPDIVGGPLLKPVALQAHKI